MHFVYYTIAGIALYFAADWLLNLIERRRGAPFAQRQLIFFAIILVLALVTFEVLERLLKP